ncbi:MAG: transcriptional regulator [Stappia sp.]|uniref:MarR family winged helix-turn-helix transcriptional regulator n=1 Tax=Stappia sp. TaxID=1870903 RepID=UPI000C5ED5F5|nr:MarR family transcriptional regulator [Stappia sp.]MAA99520.1 transcriptional regulator [Stappia sp.]MBM20411.1 transcriptional regulator [Stappia sp.]
MDPDILSRPVGFLVGDIARLLRRRFERALAQTDTGLTASEARTLAFIEHYPHFRQGALAERLGVEPMTLSGVLDRLEAAGYVERRPDPGDRRAKCVVLTDAAQGVLERIHEVAIGIRAAALDGMSDEEGKLAYALLARIHDNLSSVSEPERK